MTAKDPSTTRGARSLLPLTGVAIGVAVVVFGAGSWAGTYYSNVRVASIAVGTVGVIVWLAAALSRPSLRPVSQLSVAFAAAILALGLSALLAPNDRLALDYLGYAALLTALYFLLVVLWSRPDAARSLTAIVVVMCAGTGTVFIAVTVSTWIHLWNTIGQIVMPPLRLTYEGLWTGTPNVLAAFQVLLATTALPLLVEGGRRGRAIAGVLASVVAVDVILSASRGSWLALGLAIPVTGLAWILSRPKGRRLPRGVRVNRATGIALIAVGVAVIAIGTVTLGPALATRLSVSGADLRGSFLAASWRMFLAHPLSGIGPGSWPSARIEFTDASELDYYIPHAHNLPAEVLAELGLIGVVAAVVVAVSVAWLIYRGIRSNDASVRRAGLAALFACIYILGQQLVDEFIQQPAILFAFALPIARLDALVTASEGDVGRPAPRGRWLTVVLLVAVLVGSATALSAERAAVPYERAVAAANAGQWRDAYDQSSEAAALDPRLAPYQFVRGLGAAELGDLLTAQDAFARAAALDDYPASWLNLAAVQLRMGDPQARLALDRAVRLGQQQPQIAIPAAALYLQLGDEPKAREMLAAAFGEAASLASDPTWATGEWPRIAPGAVDDAIAQATPWSALLLALESGRVDTARDLARSVEPSRRLLADTAVAAWSGDAAAFGSLHRLAQANPMDATTVGLCRRVAWLHDPSGNAPGWSCDGGWWFGAYPLVRVGDQPSVGSIPGPAAYPHALYAYRRPGPNDLLVPWLLHLHSAMK